MTNLPITTLIAGTSPDLIEFARERGKFGERFALLSRTEPRLHEFRARLTKSEVSCEIYVADVTDSKSVVEAFKKIAVWSPRLDRLIYNVGVVSGDSAADVTESELSRVMSTNFFGFVNCFQLANQMFKRGGAGHAIVISSADALDPVKSAVAFAASKASLQIYAAALRRELQPQVKITELYLGQKSEGQNTRVLTCEEIVAGLIQATVHQPDRLLIGQP